MAIKDTNPTADAAVLALHALAWTLVEPARADRLIALVRELKKHQKAG